MKTKIGVVWLTLLCALALDILPLPTWILWLRPSWTLLVLIYWVMMIPDRISVGYAFILGVLLDLLEGTVLGQHAVAMVLVIYLVAKFYKRMQVFAIQQQMLMVFLLLLLYKLIIFILQGFLGQLPTSLLYWISILVGTLLWPWIYLLLQGWRNRIPEEF
ncbi:MAG: rod shape-determining protein MreD [Gammaproteobacteria bacterium RIFCSPHIGHO2_12_FULL_35_23]|nr:MAG: rod shape-determining protein MreD [Gammaproteobacteria bacterium RIFCSPHIGHO2_12_FULL_35_23]